MLDVLTPPPERDLPPGAHDRIGATLRRAAAVEPRSPGRHRGRLVPLAAALVLTTVAISVAALVRIPDDRPDPEPSSNLTAGSPNPTAPGLTAAETARIVRECSADIAAELGPFRLYNMQSDRFGRYALVISQRWITVCNQDVGKPRFEEGSGGTFNLRTRLTGPVDLEWLNGRDGDPDLMYAAGRVVSKVVKVELRDRGQTATTAVVNGTFLVRIPDIAPTRYDPTIIGYDAAGEVVATLRPSVDASSQPPATIPWP